MIKVTAKLPSIFSIRFLSTEASSCSTKFHPLSPHSSNLKHIHFKGIQPYQLGSRIQENLVQKFLAHKNYKILVRNPKLRDTLGVEPPEISPTVLSFEFESVYTGGKREKVQTTTDAINEIESLKQVQYVQTSRGGQITYHGPGQIVIYPILDLTTFSRLTSKCYISTLEKSIIAVLNDKNSFGLDCLTTENTGVWCHSQNSGDLMKIASIGVNVRKGVTSHGISINCNTDLSYVNDPRVVMCGLKKYKQTSMKQELSREVSLDQVAEAFVAKLADRLNIQDITKYNIDKAYDDDELLEKIASLI